MARDLPNPPKGNASPIEREQWEERLARFVRPLVATSGDADADISSNTTYHGVTALSAPRDLTLPPSERVSDAQEILIQDESGAAGSHTITIETQGTDTVNGASSVTISSNYGRKRIVKRGPGKFYAA
jgi:hypothetical protein